MINFIKKGSGIIESSYFESMEDYKGVKDPIDDMWITAFIDRCLDDDGEALQEELYEQEDSEIVSFLQECKTFLL